ncbi:MAG: hypothetical protein IPO07_30285 [Haliscomenobacter sp.]|nr:hypothetical protein [Haliscomenobacter sp.]MBK9492589.1 hypothetical protein [Haliscomenobacter sp.]
MDTVYSVTKNLKCGYGNITRTWTLTKETVKGPIVISCTQIINVGPSHEYDICFPKDVSTDCKTPVIDTVVTDELGCDILAVNIADKRYDASDDECYKIFRTYTVINWCAYDDRCGDPMGEYCWWCRTFNDSLVRDREHKTIYPRTVLAGLFDRLDEGLPVKPLKVGNLSNAEILMGVIGLMWW